MSKSPVGTARRTSLFHIVAPWGFPLLLVLVWQWSASVGLLSSGVLPAPLDVFKAAWELSASGELWENLAVSFWRAALGFTIGAGLGLTLGLVTGLSRVGETLFDSSLQMLRSIPSLAIIPLVIMWFGIGEGAKIFLVVFGTLFPVYLNTYHGIKSVDSGLIEMGRNYGLSRWGLLRYIILPGATSSILVGVRYALGVAWIVLIVAETIAASSGIGYLAMNAREFLRTDVVVLSIVLYAILGKLTDWLARLAETRWLRWHPSYQR
ncbi:aliphatic sulfonate ABC transporter permease SsuC [Agrobacterium vitis]|uniref:aliphatic sulfonate ABC transporter permease SsuC n=1 Tax=Agrobacterium vitis TaxID=373 RepID=UPI0012E7065F|nr:aliphatic sulfonate ABC transporter permease SsuC [Agrobacterium vitis]MVA52647.1 aliphatic sulfonate ABC transporter permease SsuC [Agrobacterium vitis]MVA63929.1 aliphatic sulfonate ABC transporter permease SsuC [Agrobacterium vitis]